MLQRWILSKTKKKLIKKKLGINYGITFGAGLAVKTVLCLTGLTSLFTVSDESLCCILK